MCVRLRHRVAVDVVVVIDIDIIIIVLAYISVFRLLFHPPPNRTAAMQSKHFRELRAIAAVSNSTKVNAPRKRITIIVNIIVPVIIITAARARAFAPYSGHFDAECAFVLVSRMRPSIPPPPPDDEHAFPIRNVYRNRSKRSVGGESRRTAQNTPARVRLARICTHTHGRTINKQ